MKLLKILPFASILPALMLSACGGNDSSTGAEAEADEVFTVKTATVEQRDVDDIVTLTASVEADKINNISSNSPNRIKQILVDEGMNVSKGQRLVVLDDVNTTSYQLQVDNAKAALRTVEADYNRAVELLRIGGGTRQQVDQMELQVVNARNTLASAERALRNVQENTVLTAPVSGVVTARNYDPGDMTASLPILTIGTVNPVKVVVNVNESDFAKVHTGMPATLSLQSYPDEEFTGKVTLVAPTVDAASRTFGVEITVPNPSARILPGMFGRIQLNLGTAPSAVVADKAVEKQRGSGNYFVYVVEDGKIRYSQVQLGRRLGDTYQILSGVEPGQQVVISQKSKLTDGAKVKVVK
ncbi:MAG: efflux RND transporter periplasmic adaptor subunit [Muribaculaceae bacterium]|nr:efflux RND transporter periplasmic adaptor subunit [Muribaculaceae bacterium]MDE7343641.1 efflux RND transporter periplasmic adaptor subunit [Muribaculaceae bacterium]